MDGNFITRHNNIQLDMKIIYAAIMLLLPILLKAQTISKALNPTGLSMSYAPGITLNNTTTLTNVYVDTILANTFTPGRKYEFTLYCSLSTPLTLAPTISINVILGSTSLNITSAAVLGASLTKKTFKIHVVTFANSSNSQYMFVELMSDNSAMVLGANYYSKSGTMAEDLTINQPMKVTAQFSSAVGLGSTFLYIDNAYKDNF